MKHNLLFALITVFAVTLTTGCEPATVSPVPGSGPAAETVQPPGVKVKDIQNITSRGAVVVYEVTGSVESCMLYASGYFVNVPCDPGIHRQSAYAPLGGGEYDVFVTYATSGSDQEQISNTMSFQTKLPEMTLAVISFTGFDLTLRWGGAAALESVRVSCDADQAVPSRSIVVTEVSDATFEGLEENTTYYCQASGELSGSYGDRITHGSNVIPVRTGIRIRR